MERELKGRGGRGIRDKRSVERVTRKWKGKRPLTFS